MYSLNKKTEMMKMNLNDELGKKVVTKRGQVKNKKINVRGKNETK